MTAVSVCDWLQVCIAGILEGVSCVLGPGWLAGGGR
jgi:hypothetical protein